ncbi:hypothetical protein Bsp3421_000119 (plasmid) [Burkholderia sp. FERM BP-3421]|uniref:hypothetical protein n=1 Tax=Burkholderia sp. FERM BP-3421 TaxID=1494466 RepID=UPI00235EF1E9|nr:hypothetical protein [Burkholderia sp. FERM BP-3421]WDD90294.1 hypothetical protein Bsp3421_000119 [Burkholderia sp. FERM BP-3421]
MRYVVVAGEHMNKASEAVVALEQKVNEAIQEGAVPVGGISVVCGRSSRNFGLQGYQAFQAVIFEK